jgi:hypothetical protein
MTHGSCSILRLFEGCKEKNKNNKIEHELGFGMAMVKQLLVPRVA